MIIFCLGRVGGGGGDDRNIPLLPDGQGEKVTDFGNKYNFYFDYLMKLDQ